MSDKTRGHGTRTMAAIWKDRLAGLLAEEQGAIQRRTPFGLMPSRDQMPPTSLIAPNTLLALFRLAVSPP